MSQGSDHHLTALVFWGILFVLFLCISNKHVVRKFCHLIGCRSCWREEESAPSDGSDSGRAISRKQELDSLRASVLSYRLYPCSMTLEKKHMLRRISDAGSPAPSPNTEPMPQDRIQTPGHCGATHNDDIETGGARRGIDPPDCDEEETRDVYTHVSLPLPGHNFDGVKRLDAGDSGHTKEEKKNRVFSSTDKDITKTAEVLPNTKYANENGTGRRSHPRFCAICLGEFEVPERVSWSSNPACTHVFHEDCVTQWLVTLGRTRRKLQRFSANPSAEELLNYELECPCCRQEFILTEADLVDACAREESV